MSKYGDKTPKQEVYMALSNLRRNQELNIKEFACIVMSVLSDMMESGYDYYGKVD